MEPKVKVFVSYHKPAVLLKSEVLTPVHVGRSLVCSDSKDGKLSQDNYQWMLDNMIGDNTGDNISHLNRRFSEVTCQYFVWKNQDKLGNPDYIGFMHYGRHLNFNLNKKYEENIFGTISAPFAEDAYFKKFDLCDENIIAVCKEYDIITAKKWDVSAIGSENIYCQYKNSKNILNIADYDIGLDVLLKKYPEYKAASEEYNSSSAGYFTNIYIMKKELFNSYCEWLFPILFECEDRIPYCDDIQKNRVIGHIAERLFGIYITYLRKHNPEIKIKELQRTSVSDTEIGTHIPVVFSCDDKYCQHLYCAITSILMNKADSDRLYFYVLINKMSRKNIRRLTKLCKSYKVRLDFIKINEEDFKNCPLTESCKHISIATYYRFMLSSLLPQLDKVLYLDCDITVQGSLAEFYQTDISNGYFAAVKDILFKQNTQRLNIEKYCNAGVMLINLQKWREDDVETKLFEFAKENAEKIKWVDQDVLNYVMQSGIIYVDSKWNNMVGQYQGCYEQGFNDNAEKSVILHYVGAKKPWVFGCVSPIKKPYFDSLMHTPYVWKMLIYKLYEFICFCKLLRRKVISVKLSLKCIRLVLFNYQLLYKEFNWARLFSVEYTNFNTVRVIRFLGIKIKKNVKKEFTSIKIRYSKFFDRLYISSGRGFESRHANSIYLFNIAFQRVRDKVKRSFAIEILTDDVDVGIGNNESYFVYSSNKKKLSKAIMIPDFVFTNWVEAGIKDYDDVCGQIAAEGEKIPIYNQLFWIGNVKSHPLRGKLMDLYAGNSKFCFMGMNWIRNGLSGQSQQADKFVSLPEHTHYKYLLEIRGLGYSGRYKLLMFSNRPIFYVERDDIEFFTRDLKPFVHYIPVKEDLSDLEEMYDWAEAHPEECKQIAKNALEYAQNNLTREKAIEYYSRIILDCADRKR